MTKLLPRWIAAAALLLALAPSAFADDYPSKPVRLIIPFPPGGSNDVVGRLVAQQLSVKLGQQVYVDNRGGAGGTIGTEALRDCSAGRLYDLRDIDCARGQSGAVHPQIRPDQIIHADLDLRDRTERAGGQSDIADQNREGLAQARQRKAGRTQLRLRRRRQLPASGRRVVQAAGQASISCTSRTKAADRRCRT